MAAKWRPKRRPGLAVHAHGGRAARTLGSLVLVEAPPATGRRVVPAAWLVWVFLSGVVAGVGVAAGWLP